jgi:mono/diheme cytochrome c family protein
MQTVRNRVVVLIAACLTCLTVVVVAVPILGSAQDATPDAAGEAETQQLIQRGEEIYSTVCIACHQPDGKGIDGIYPPLAGNPLITLEDPTYFTSVVLTGRGGMPRFSGTYDDEEIASVVTYVRQAWENDASAVSPEFVAEVRAGYEVQEAETSGTPQGQIPEGIATPQATPTFATPAGVEEATPAD